MDDKEKQMNPDYNHQIPEMTNKIALLKSGLTVNK